MQCTTPLRRSAAWSDVDDAARRGVFGGVGSGLYDIIFAIVACSSRLMIGRTPEYLGKKIERRNQDASNRRTHAAAGGAFRHRDRGDGGCRQDRCCQPWRARFSEILYAFSSAGNNNGSAFADCPRTRRSITLRSVSPCSSRVFWLAIRARPAGALAAKKGFPRALARCPTHNVLFVAMLIGTVIVIGALTFFPALALGPISSTWCLRKLICLPCRIRSPKHDYPSTSRRSHLARSLVTKSIFKRALIDSLVKLLPQHQWRNPVMFVVYAGSILTTILWFRRSQARAKHRRASILAVTLCWWFTVLFANFAEAIAEAAARLSRCAASGKARHDGEETCRTEARCSSDQSQRHHAAQGRSLSRGGGRLHSGRRRGDRRCGVGR